MEKISIKKRTEEIAIFYSKNKIWKFHFSVSLLQGESGGGGANKLELCV